MSLMHSWPLPNWVLGATVTGHQAQEGRNPWVRDGMHLRIPKGVIVDGKLCAELLRPDRKEYTTIG